MSLLNKEIKMNRIFADADVGRKNIVFGIVLFLILGVGVGIPLTINFLGGSLLTSDQYQTWKVVHGYGVFLSFINYFFGSVIDRLELTRPQKEISSWSFLVAGMFGGVIRMILVLSSLLNEYGMYVSLVETALITIGTMIFLHGQMKAPQNRSLKTLEKRAALVSNGAVPNRPSGTS
jgi:hypothetical protein